MAKIHHVVDDIDGSTPAETVVFGLPGGSKQLVIDLSATHARELMDALDLVNHYVAAGKLKRPRAPKLDPS